MGHHCIELNLASGGLEDMHDWQPPSSAPPSGYRLQNVGRNQGLKCREFLSANGCPEHSIFGRARIEPCGSRIHTFFRLPLRLDKRHDSLRVLRDHPKQL